jgi:hypothetical protein
VKKKVRMNEDKGEVEGERLPNWGGEKRKEKSLKTGG